jgi:hypothetical protein
VDKGALYHLSDCTEHRAGAKRTYAASIGGVFTCEPAPIACYHIPALWKYLHLDDVNYAAPQIIYNSACVNYFAPDYYDPGNVKVREDWSYGGQLSSAVDQMFRYADDNRELDELLHDLDDAVVMLN